jgi:hypothetical protein
MVTEETPYHQKKTWQHFAFAKVRPFCNIGSRESYMFTKAWSNSELTSLETHWEMKNEAVRGYVSRKVSKVATTSFLKLALDLSIIS